MIETLDVKLQGSEHGQVGTAHERSTPEMEDWQIEKPLPKLLFMLAAVDDKVRTLSDPRLTDEEHSEAAREIVGALRTVSHGLLASRPAFPEITTPSSETDEFLAELGLRIDWQVQTRGLFWPPPRKDGASSAALDLQFLYRCASRSDPVSSDQLRQKIQKLEQLTGNLFDNWTTLDRRRITEALKQKDPDSPTSRIGAVLSSSALLISLIQGPGALHDLPGDIENLGGDIGSVVSAVMAGLSWLLDALISLILPLVT